MYKNGEILININGDIYIIIYNPTIMGRGTKNYIVNHTIDLPI